MKIREISINGFGKFHRYNVSFSDGIQVIYGRNEAGKTTMRQFMISMLFGMEKGRGLAARNDEYTRYQPLRGGTYGGSMTLEKDRKTYRIWRNLESAQKEVRLFDEDSMEEIPLFGQDLQGVLLSESKTAFLNTVSMTQADIRTGKEMQQLLQNDMANLSQSSDSKTDIAKAVDYLKIKRRDARKNPVFLQVSQLRQQLQTKEFDDRKLEQYDYEEAQILKKLSKKKTYGLFQRILRFLQRLFGIDKDAEQKREWNHRLEIIRLEQNHLKKQKEQWERLKQEYKEARIKEQEVQEDIKAIEEAIHAIETAAEGIQKSFGVELNEMLSAIFSKMTDGVYSQAVMDESMNITVRKDHEFIDMKYLSNGTVEQIYFALRLAAADLLYQQDNFPLFLDDVFGNYDDERLRKTLSYLAQQKERQVFLFTCRQETLRQLEEAGAEYHVVSL